ncbi:nucleotidyltransferase domain-containing protein [Lactiplantibacillus pingfangensis]|uniref:nucleotidyltransferase domain-containing protein n=1 Tax=Lactiplantibacillus pingfangensis TaxID=2559915 RepID=UPI0010F55E66|nr:nucleotidyltransferase [Lactiplantibacillus pingfangensis]
MKDTSYILEQICQKIVLSDTAKETVVREYTALGNLISSDNRVSNAVDIKPQGSYNLGTAIKPINGSDDDFDIDLVAIVHGESSPKKIKHLIGNILKTSDAYASKLQPEKNRAWTIKYFNSHVDVVPATDSQYSDVLITNRLSIQNYGFRQSSPFKFKKWFAQKGQDVYQYSDIVSNRFSDEVETPEEYHEYTILQEVVQLLKYHRNKMFEKRDDKSKPISMIITILAAEAYTGQDDLSEALVAVTNGLRNQIKYDSQGFPHILNPTNKDEDFTDKWRLHPERKDAFFEWLQVVESNLGTTNQTEMIPWKSTLADIYGKTRVQEVFEYLGKKRSVMQLQGQVPLSSEGVFGGEISDKKVRPHTFWGD